jgi:hypothetical protein
MNVDMFGLEEFFPSLSNKGETSMTLSKDEQEALNAWLTLRQDIIEGKPVNLKLMARKDQLMRRLDSDSPVFTHINIIKGGN